MCEACPEMVNHNVDRRKDVYPEQEMWRERAGDAAEDARKLMEGLTPNRYRHEHALIAQLEALRLEIRAASLR